MKMLQRAVPTDQKRKCFCTATSLPGGRPWSDTPDADSDGEIVSLPGDSAARFATVGAAKWRRTCYKCSRLLNGLLLSRDYSIMSSDEVLYLFAGVFEIFIRSFWYIHSFNARILIQIGQ